MNKQTTLSALTDELAQVRTKKKEFLEQMDRLIPWGEWITLIQPFYYKGERGNKPYDLELMLRIYILQNLYDLSDEGTVAEVMLNITNELKKKLLDARSDGEVASLLKESGMDDSIAEQLWKEINAHRDDRELYPDELEAVSGGADRDWLTDGCAAMVEPDSTCSSNDACWYWDVEYAHEPREICSRCGGIVYIEYRHTGLGSMQDHYKCSKCGREKDV